MNFLFAWRYFKSKKDTNAINIISWISVLAITVVVAALIIVFSVFNGFEDLVKGLYADFYADINIKASKGKIISLTEAQLQQINTTNGIAQYSLVVEEKALLVNGENQTIAFLKGVDNHYNQVNNIANKNHILRGEYNLGTIQNPNLFVGAGIENALLIDVVSDLSSTTIYLPNKETSSNVLSSLNSFKLIPTGTFTVQQEFDNKYVFTNIGFVKYMLSLTANQYTSCEIKLAKNANEKQIVKQLETILGKDFKVQTRYQQNQSLYTAMQVEKWVIYGITCLILSVAAFNIVGAITMLVLEKQKDISVLKAMGASNALIQKIFLTEGLLLCSIGTALGTFLATIICLAQLQFHFIKLEGGTFLINYYPVKLMFSDYLIVIVTVFIIAFFAAYLPSSKASKQLVSLKS